MAKYLCILVRAYWFSVTSFSKWLPGGHIRVFGFWMAWFRQRNSSLLWNFNFKFHVHVLCGCRQKPNDCQLCRFQNGCLVILNNVQLQSLHCPLPPSPMGRGYPCRSLIYNFLLLLFSSHSTHYLKQWWFHSLWHSDVLWRQHWFGHWLDALRHQATKCFNFCIKPNNVDFLSTGSLGIHSRVMFT